MNIYRNLINGQWLETEETYVITNPADKTEQVGRFPLSTTEDVEQAILAADTAFQKWKDVPAGERAEYVYRFIQLLDENRERLAVALTKEQGKPLKESRTEALRGVKEMRYVAGEAARLEGIVLPSDRVAVTNVASRVPIGVVAAITPWNFPLLTPLRKIIPALIAGCTVVVKPASDTPLTAILLAELLQEAGLPDGTVNLIMGRGRQIGNALIQHPLVKGVSFTGSTSVGRQINVLAAETFTKVQLEMGGKNPVVVADFANLDHAAEQIVGSAYTNAGQRCTAISRVIVLEPQAEQLEKLIVEKVQRYTVGNGMDESINIGPVINKAALQTIAGYVESALQEGARIATGGEALRGGIYDNGSYFEPTVISDVTPQMRVAKEEIFGPVITITRVSTIEEAITICNDTEYGLTSAIFTDRMAWGHQFMQQVESGMIHINNGTISEGHMPFGGLRNSGHGTYSIGQTNKDFFTEYKVVYTQF